MVDLEELKKKLALIESEITDQYLNDDLQKSWVVGFSGGKDSTMLLQLVWNAISKIPKEKRNKSIFVVTNDTLVENPLIISFINKILSKIQKEAEKQCIPLTVHKTKPVLKDTFWVNLIGKGYSPPNNFFRWCTDRLKIKPMTKFMKEKTDSEGQVLLLLGTRIDESASRAKSIKKHTVAGERINKHPNLPKAYIYTPITKITTEEVWQYLTAVPAPWGEKHHRLITLYKNANSGECPLVIDKTTSSCGNSRFGCWVCTVVNKDKSMGFLIENGEEWMEPLLELRDFLYNTNKTPEKYRSKIKRNGAKVEKGYGPFLPETRFLILRKLLEAQKIVQIELPTMQLISQEELNEIQEIWHKDGIFEYDVLEFYKQMCSN